ncbi:MAG: hypothetical protein KJZ93_26625, partial [Caldilineaceae bacterium]|nr:hypothetical protein [Caldilineaceae bacterium]
GIQRSVQFENQLFSSRYTPKSDAELAGEVRTLSGGSKLAVVVIDFKIMRSFDEVAAAAKYFNGARQSLPKGRVQEAKAAIKALKNNLSTQKLRGAGVAVTTLVIVGGLTTAYYFKQQGQQEAAIAISSFLIAAQVVLSVYGPISAVNAWWTALARAGSSASILTAQTELIGVSRTANVIGAVLVISIVWGFFLYNVLSSDTPTASIEFNVALAEAIATTIYIILLTIISATVVGLILVGIVSVVDAILTAVCEFAGGSCFTIGGAVISALANAFYTYNLFIETNRADLIQPGAPQTTLADPNRGFVAGNDLRITLPITTHIVQKNPVSDVTDQYSHLLHDSLRATTFRYSLSQPGPQDAPNSGRGSMWGDWHRLHEVGRFDWYRLYGAYANTTPTPVGGFNLPAGLNRPAPFYLNMGYAIPAYDCWRIYVLSGDFPFYKKIPVCSERTINGKNSTPISSLRYDIFPSTFGGFVALAQKPGGGYGLTWDSAFTALRDADGDGLVSAAFGGLDPDDTKWDSDGDGLSDAFELEQRAAGIAYSPTQCDTDGDGLTDAQEAHFGTDPANPDSDNDGLLDREEVWHQVYNTTTCQPTSNWAGGWNVTLNATTPFTIRVTSNPLLADSDGDGVSDLAEKQLAGQLDSQNRPYHPGVVNAPPVAVYTDTERRFVAPGSNLVYTTTVVANTPLSPGVLDVAAPAQLGGVRPSYALNFNPATFSGSQTVVQQTALTAQSGLNSQVVALSSNVRTRLAPTGPATLTWEPVTFQSLGSTPQTPRFMAPTASTIDRQDSYLLATQTSNNLNRGGAGSVLANVIPGGALTTLFSSSAPSNSMGAEPLDVACNQAGLCLAVWSYRDHTNGTYDALRGVVLRADGQVQSNVAFPVDFYVGYFYPQVASDGVDFLVASEKTNGLSTDLAIQRVNTAGVVVSDQSYQIENPRVAAGSTNSVALDLAWLGDRYGVAWKFIRPTGGAALPGFYTGLIDRTGAAIGGLANLFGTSGRDITWDATGAPALAYDSVNNRSLVLYKSTLNNSLVAYLFQGSNITTFSGLKSGWLGDMIGVAAQSFPTNQPPRLAYNPLVNGWFLTTGVSGTTVTRLLAPDLTRQLLDAQAISGSSDLPIACPMVSSMPVADFRFEELPGAVTFADSSLRNNATSCPTGSCPVGGAPGATDQAGNPIGGGPLGAASDYAVQFDGFENTLDVGNPLGSEFSIAFWYKAGSSSESLPFRVESGFALQTGPPDGFSLRIYNNINLVFFSAGGVATSNAVPTPLNNGAWRFVVATRTSNGNLAVHIDGNPTPIATASGSVTPAMFNTVRLRDGGTNVQLDNLRFYNVALSGGAIQALYNGAQSYCAGFAPSTYRWARVNASIPDTRGGKITASGGLTVTIDADRPSSTISGFTQGQFIPGNRIHIIGGNASDPTSGVGRVEVSVNNGAFQPASGKASWAYDLAVGEGEYTIRTRAIDLVNNPESSGASVTVRADATAPQVTLTPPPATPIKITRNGANRWFATLSGSASDPISAGVASGLGANAVEVLLQGQADAPGNGWQTATLSGNSWTLDYLFAEGLPDPTGTYTVSVRAVDNVGNRTPDNAATGTLRLDMSGPAAVLSVADAQRRVITNTLTLSGIVTDTGPIGRPAGVDKVELAFVSVEQIAALSNDITAEQADAQLNRTWLPVNLAQRGAGVSAWSFPIPSGLENEYQIDLRATDMLGNVLRSDNVWRGVIDTLAPRVTASAVRINNAYVIPNQVACQAIDRYIDESRFDCEIYNGNIVDRIFDNHPALQTLFPDRTILMGLSKSMTYWSPIYPAPFNVRACDYYGHCTTVNSGPVVIDPTANVSLAASASESVSGASVSSLQSPDSADPPGATVAAVVSPAPGNVVAADDTLNVTVAAESSALLKEVTVHLDGNLVQTLSFAQNENATRILRTFQLTGISEGQHTFVARATDWAGGAQDNDIPATFTVDRQPPTVTIAAATLTNADTWAVGSGVLRFNGTASDSIGLAAVQIREGNSSFVDVQFGNGVWQTALPVTDPEGRSLHITVRAIDRAGRMSQATQTIGTDLSSPDAPDTTITSGPANPSATNTAGFEFSGSESAVAFACQLDESAFAPCASPWSYSDLSKGEHTFRVRAIDGEGNVDLTPASYTWTVNASA